jgi:hypothetical protein
VTGLPGHPAGRVRFDDVRITTAGGGEPWPPDRSVPECPADYPQPTMFGPLPAHGLYARHVHGLTLARFAVDVAAPDGRPAIVFDDVTPA